MKKLENFDEVKKVGLNKVFFSKSNVNVLGALGFLLVNAFKYLFFFLKLYFLTVLIMTWQSNIKKIRIANKQK